MIGMNLSAMPMVYWSLSIDVVYMHTSRTTDVAIINPILCPLSINIWQRAVP